MKAYEFSAQTTEDGGLELPQPTSGTLAAERELYA